MIKEFWQKKRKKNSSQDFYCKSEISSKEKKCFVTLVTLFYLGYLQRIPQFDFLSMNESKTFYIGESRIKKKKSSRIKRSRSGIFFSLKLYTTAQSLTCSPKSCSLFFPPNRHIKILKHEL